MCGLIRSRGLVLAVTLLAAAATARLGFWQLDRAAVKQGLQASVAQRAAEPVLPQADLARDEASAELQYHRRIHAHGQWLSRHTVYLDNRQMNGHPGFFVLTPLLLAPGDAVLVQRGWVPRDAAHRSHVKTLQDPPGVVSVLARVAAPPSKLFEMHAGDAGVIRQNLDLAAFSREIGVRLRPLSLQQIDGPDSPADGLQRQWFVPAVDVDKHHGYAFQWFALCALILGLYVWFQLIQPRRQSRRA
ncbi:MAG: SURF1 family protein [Ideonella sp.]|nr:SURF1 family protein [Ideonella sp.]